METIEKRGKAKRTVSTQLNWSSLNVYVCMSPVCMDCPMQNISSRFKVTFSKTMTHKIMFCLVVTVFLKIIPI